MLKQPPAQYTGLSIDVLKSIASKENWELEFVHGSWKSVFASLEKREIDLLVGIAYTEKRAEKFDYTKQTLINNWGVIYRHPNSDVTSLADLEGKRVALMSRSIHSRVFKQLMKNFNFEFEAVEVTTYIGGLEAVENGDADATVLNRVISLLNSHKYHAIETGIIFNPVEVRYAAPKNKNAGILAIIDKHLAEQKLDPNSAYHASLEKWLNPVKKVSIPTWVFYIGGFTVLMIVVLIINNILISKKVADRTAKLSESELRFRQLAENINEIFWIGSPNFEDFYYVSPAFERVWGLYRDDLYENSQIWFSAIHHEDKQTVMSDIHLKASGDLAKPAIPEFRIITPDGEIKWISARAYPIRDDAGKVTRIAGIAEDITKRKKDDETINYMAHHDPLTRLKNRYAFENELVSLMENVPKPGLLHSLMYIDLDQFKIVNDTCGHSAGDKMLIKLTSLLQSVVADQAVLARLGGDEFGIIMKNTTIEESKKLAQHLLDSIKSFRFYWRDRKFTVGASIGMVAIEDEVLVNKFDLLSAADLACYAAKERGRNRIHVYSEDDSDLLQRHGEMQWVEKINQALEENRFSLYRQIIHPLKSGNSKVPSYEYLLRMLDDEGNLVMPNLFIPAAERFELMPHLDRWVVKNVFAHLEAEHASGKSTAALPMAFINLSGQVFTDEKFEDYVIQQTEKYKVTPEIICFEITETATISNLDIASKFINKLRDHGFKFALDDFGTGMSSFSYLLTLPVDFVKIDGVFIKDLLDAPMNSTIVDAITKVSHTANLKVIAEWVENTEVLNSLAQLGIDYAQGYAIDRPSPVPEYEKLDIANK